MTGNEQKLKKIFKKKENQCGTCFKFKPFFKAAKNIYLKFVLIIDVHMSFKVDEELQVSEAE